MEDQFEELHKFVDSKFLFADQLLHGLGYKAFVYTPGGFQEIYDRFTYNNLNDPRLTKEAFRNKFYRDCVRSYFISSNNAKLTRIVDSNFIVDRNLIDQMVSYLIIKKYI